MKASLADMMDWDDRYRIKFINSISGYKGVHLIGTINSQGKTNLAVFNSVVHIGANPPLIGFITRPLTNKRDSYNNIIETGYYTINHVHRSFLKQAHYTSTKFPENVSEFEKCNLNAEYSNTMLAPYVKESNIKLGLKFKESQEVQTNNTLLIVGELQEVIINDDFIEEDGQIDLEKAKNVCVTGLNQYSTVSKFINLPFARLEEFPRFKENRPDNIVFDEETQSYNANILPYGTNIGAPNIEPTGVSTWVNTSINSFNHSFQNKIELIKKNYKNLINEYEINELLYKASMNFEPIIGKEYYLYFSEKKGGNFLSLIPPSCWNMEYLGTYTLNNDKTWIKSND